MELKLKAKGGEIYSHLRKKFLIKTPEELVRQEYLLKIVNHYGYTLDQIGEEVSVTSKGSGQARADFLIWRSIEDKKSKKPPIIVIECKADNVTINKKVYGQGENYARIIGAPFFVTHNNNETKYWRVKKDRMPGYIEELEDIPLANSTDKQIEELLKKLKVFKENEFADLLHQCHNIIRNREKLDPAAAFDEIAKVLFMKVFAERNLTKDMKGNIFNLEYIEQGEKFMPGYVYEIFEKTKKDFGKDKIFKTDETLNLKVNTVKAIIEKLERYNLSATSTDIKGIAFERFLGKTFRGEIGQFFTPRPIVEFMIKMIEPKEDDVICDPASGSGGFLIRFFEIVRELISQSVDNDYKNEKEKIEANPNEKDETKAILLNKIFNKLNKELEPTKVKSRIWKLANRCIYGIDANERMARTSKMNMIMHGDGHGGIHWHDGFLDVNGIFEERFDVVLTNPPFGQNVEEDDLVVQSQLEVDDETKEYYLKIYGDSYIKSQDKIKAYLDKPITSLYDLPKNKSIKTEILFIERCISLLKPGGRLGIVLPEGVFNTSSLTYVREYVEDNAKISAMISMPLATFSSSGARVKASLLFLNKFSKQEAEEWQEILNKAKKTILNSQKTDRKNLEKIISDKEKTIDNKKIAKNKIKELDKIAEVNGRILARSKFKYFIFMAEAEHVGISTTGEEDANELPNIYEKYKEFGLDQRSYKRKLKKSSKILKDQIFIPKFGDLKKWTVPVNLLLNYKIPSGWSLLPMSDFAKLVEEKVKVEPNIKYKMAGVKWYGEGIFYRETVTGKEISAKYLTPVKPNALIYNRLFAWKQSFAVVPIEFNDLFVSNEFPQFIIDESIVLPEYIYLFFIREQVNRAVLGSSSGSAAVSRNRFKEEDFLSFEVPIPAKEKQLEIVIVWESIKAKEEELKLFAQQKHKEIDNLITKDIFQ